MTTMSCQINDKGSLPRETSVIALIAASKTPRKINCGAFRKVASQTGWVLSKSADHHTEAVSFTLAAASV